jgi:hypothetical protein
VWNRNSAAVDPELLSPMIVSSAHEWALALRHPPKNSLTDGRRKSEPQKHRKETHCSSAKDSLIRKV